jgi:dTDP-4-amino-4,6-dideoxygalactose transaminase
MMQVPLLDLKPQYAPLREEIRKVLDEVCESQHFILGPRVEAFEKEAARYCGAAHAVGMSSGTDALLAALMAAEVGPGDLVLTTPYSFFATAGCIVRLGAIPLFADIDPATFNLDPAQARRVAGAPPARFRGRPLKALLPVHLYGQSADMDPLLALARERGLAVIEDACQSIGAEYPSAAGPRKTGAMGLAGCYSFFPSKNLGCFGDGGLVTTRDAAFAERLKALRNHGSKVKYHHLMVGGNFRLDALQAAVLSVKLPYLDGWHAKRRENAAFYDAAFAGTAVTAPPCAYRGAGLAQPHIYNQYVVRVPERDRVRERLTAAGVGCEVYYPVPLHLQECFRDLGYTAGDFPESERAAAETLAIPIFPELAEAQRAAVAEAVLAAVR